jgi:hypothetical protein
MTYLEGQFEIEKAYVAYFGARITSGGYKQRVGNVWMGDGRVLTEEEILEDELQTMRSHIKIMGDLLNKMNEETND